MKILLEMSCPECGFRLDPANASLLVCPACGANPADPARYDDDSDLAAAFEDGEAFAGAPVTLTEVLGCDAPTEPETGYVPDPELEFAIADAEALREALTEGGPIL